MKIRLGHSPDSDDAFMFWALASGEVRSNLEFEHVLQDIQTLSEWAREGRLEVTAISVHAYAFVADRYALLRHGGSFGEGYGPLLVARETLEQDELARVKIAVPGLLTSAYLELCLFFDDLFGPGVRPDVAVEPFDRIMEAVRAGRYDAGLLIHEGQLTYAREGFVKVADLGEWWQAKTGLPLPLGVNVVRKDLGEEVIREVARALRESILVGMRERSRGLAYAMQFARGMDEATGDRFVGMYVNDRTLDMGEEGLRAIRLLLSEGHRIGLVPEVEVEAVG